ncbi:hypothetical protein Tco_0140741 [Tanacetum coccineum]
MAGSDDEIPPPPPPPPAQTPTQQAPHTMSTIKLLILKKEKKKKSKEPPYLCFYSKTILSKIHKMTDAKDMWDAIKSRFGGNDESKKMQKYILKQQFEGFSVSNSEGLHKGYDRFQSLLSQLETHGAGVELNKKKGKGTGQGENRPVWNNVQRLNNQNKFVPTAVLTRTCRIPVNTASHNFNSQAVSTSATRKVNADRPIDNPQRALKNKGIVDSGCSRHMTGNNAYLAEYQDYTGGPVAFGGSKGYITGKACLIANATFDESNKWHKRAQVDQGSQIKMIHVKEMMQDNDLKNSKSKDKGSKSRSQSMNEQSRYKQDKTRTRQSINIKRHIFNVIGGTEEFKERDLNIGGDCTQDNIDAGNSEMEAKPAQDYFVLPIWSSYTSTIKSSEAKNEGEKPNKDIGLKTNDEQVDQEDQVFLEELERLKRQEKEANNAAKALRKDFAQDAEDLLLQAGAARATSTNTVNTASIPVSTVSPSDGLSYTDLTNTDQDDSQIPALEDIYDNPNDGIFTNASYDDEDPKSAVQTRSKVNKSSGAHDFVSYIQKQRRNNHKDFQHCLFACFLSQIEPKKISKALEDESWVDAMQEELLQFKIQKVWILVDLPYRKKAIGTKWVYRNKKGKRGVVVRNKARLVA